MVTLPGGRFWSFCWCAAVLGVMTLKPEATSMLSLFCVLVCVLAQPNNNAAHATVIVASKIRLSGFIGLMRVLTIKFQGMLSKVSVVTCGRCATQKLIPPWMKGPFNAILLVTPPWL